MKIAPKSGLYKALISREPFCREYKLQKIISIENAKKSETTH